MKATDLCFYMSVTKEENSAFILAHPNQDKDTSSGGSRLNQNHGGGGSSSGSDAAAARLPQGGNYSKVASMIASVGEQQSMLYIVLTNIAKIHEQSKWNRIQNKQ